MPSLPTSIADIAGGLANTILRAIQREYPHQLAHTLRSPDDHVRSPRQIHPSFYGCYDWHSSVHMHYSLIRLLRTAHGSFDGAAVRRVLQQNLNPSALMAEARFIRENPTWERPYGWGWALMLADELADFAASGDTDARRWARDIMPLAEAITDHMLLWLPKMTYPVRHGNHGNTAFAMDLALRWGLRRAASTGETILLDMIVNTSQKWYDQDRNAPLAYEPQGTDFLSPALAEAALMAEILTPETYSSWLARFLPTLSFSAGTLGEPLTVIDPSDGQLAHLDGLNLSRAWMLRRVARTLPDFDLRRRVCEDAAQRNLAASLRAASNGHYMSEHWLATFAILALEAR